MNTAPNMSNQMRVNSPAWKAPEPTWYDKILASDALNKCYNLAYKTSGKLMGSIDKAIQGVARIGSRTADAVDRFGDNHPKLRPFTNTISASSSYVRPWMHGARAILGKWCSDGGRMYRPGMLTERDFTDREKAHAYAAYLNGTNGTGAGNFNSSRSYGNLANVVANPYTFGFGSLTGSMNRRGDYFTDALDLNKNYNGEKTGWLGWRQSPVWALSNAAYGAEEMLRNTIMPKDSEPDAQKVQSRISVDALRDAYNRRMMASQF